MSCKIGKMGGELRRVDFRDILDYKFLSGPKISPDGSRAAFFVHQGDLNQNCYNSNLWLCDLDLKTEPVQLTFSGKERAFCWSVDGQGLYFLSERGNKDFPGLYWLDLRGGEARLVAELSRAASAVWDLGDGNLLLLTNDPREPLSVQDDPKHGRFEGDDYLVLEQLPFCTNGKGFTGQARSRLALLKPDLTLLDLTPPTMNVQFVHVKLKPEREIYLTGCDYTHVMPLTTGIWKIALAAGSEPERGAELTKILPQGVYRWSCVMPFNDGNTLLAAGTDMKRHGLNENRKFFTVSINNINNINNLECLTPELDTGLHNSAITDCRMGCDRGATFLVDVTQSQNQELAWFITTIGYRAKLCTLDTQGVTRVVIGDGEEVRTKIRSVEDFDVKNGRVILVGLAGLSLPELFILEPGSSSPVRLTDFNSAALADINMSVPEYVRVENGTPEGIEGWYMRPVGFEVGKKYPTILNIHGGPKMAYSDLFDHEMQCWTAKGFVVLFCNPRGSDGRGDAFADIRGKYGHEDYQDIMTFLDWAVQTLPFVDENRLGVTGGSYGGFMTNWIISHTARFRAAVTQRSISNWVSMVGMSDIGYFFAPDQQGGDLGEDISVLWDHSPLKYAGQVRTPTLIIHSDEDYRCELGQGLQFFTALRRNNVECKMCQFKHENHELSRSGRPRARLARLQEITRWFTEKL